MITKMATDERIDAKMAELNDLKQMLDEATETMQTKSNRVKDVEAQMSQMQSTMQDLELGQKSKDQDIEVVRANATRERVRLQEQLSRVKKMNDNLLQETKALREQLATTQSLVGRQDRDSCGQCRDLQVQLEEAKGSIAQQAQQLDAISKEKQTLTQQMEYYQTKVSPEMLAAQAGQFATDKDSERLREQIRELEKLKEDLQKDAAVLRGQLPAEDASSCTQCVVLQDQLNDIGQQLAQRYEQLEAVSVEKLHLQQEMDKLEGLHKPKALDVAKFTAEKERERLSKVVEDLEKVNEELRVELERVRRELESMRKASGIQADDLRTLAELRAELARANESIRLLEEEIKRLEEERTRRDTELLEQSRGRKRILYSATAGLVVELLLRRTLHYLRR